MPRGRPFPVDYVISGSWQDGTAEFNTDDPVLDEVLKRFCLLAKCLRERRLQLEWSFEKTAKRAGLLRRQTVSDLEKGRSWPDAETLQRLVIALGFDIVIRDDPKVRPGLRPADA